MKRPARILIPSAISVAILATPAFAHAAGNVEQSSQQDATEPSAAKDIDTILVVGQRASRVSNGATNLDLAIKDTPQSISVVTKEQIEQFGATNLNDALRLATGIQVEEVSTNQTQFLSRGFEIKNTQIDGIGLPNGWGVVTNAMDSYGFEKVEVIRGANGLLTGVGNAAGTINYVRKRPTNDEQGEIGISYGSWGTKRIEADVSTPLTSSGTWAARLVAAHEEGGSYLRDFDSDRTYLYGMIDGQVGDSGALAIGYSWQKVKTTGNMWGTLTFVDNAGNQLEWDDSASTTQDWTHWNTTTKNAFIEYTQQLGYEWQLKASYNYREYDNDAELFMAYAPAGLDAATGEGLYGWAYRPVYKTTANLGDLTLNGRFDMFGREQEVTFGVSYAKSEAPVDYYPADFSGAAFGALPGFPYAGNAIAEPTWGEPIFYYSLNQSLKRAYGVTRLALTDRLKAIVGVNYAEYHRDGLDEEGVAFDQTKGNTSPYAGLTFDFTDHVLGYVSYSYIFQPQDDYDVNHRYVDPSKGVNYEAGIKAEWFDRRLLTTLAVFDAKQDGLATYAGTAFQDGYAFAYYTGIDVESKGVEFEATGKLGEYVDLVLGYTHLKMTGEDDQTTYPWVPRNVVNLAISARVPGTTLSLGISDRVQSEISNADTYTGYVVRQSGYSLLNAFAAWDILPNLTLRANANNITDKKYIKSLYVASYYGAPSNYSVSLDWRF